MVFVKAVHGPGGMEAPKGIAVGSDGVIYLADGRLHMVQLFNEEGQALMFVGGGGREPRKLLLPAGVWLQEEVPEFAKQFVHPSLKARGLLLVTSQGSVNQVSVFALVEPRAKTSAPTAQTEPPNNRD